MRATNLFAVGALALLAGCATQVPEWQLAQQERLLRLERSHRTRSLDDAVQAAIAAAPDVPVGAARPPAAQDPQGPPHLDQRLPPPIRRGERSFRHSWQPLVATLDVGVGDVMARASGTRLDDRAGAVFARARLDAGTGAALHAEWWGGDDDLYAGRRINDGVEPRPAAASLSGIDVFPHLRFDHAHGALQVPVRVGAFVDWQQLDHHRAAVERDWLSAGVRLAVEPTWTLLDGHDGELQLFTRVGGDVGAAWFREEFRNGAARDMLPRWAGELGCGLRGRLGALHAELGYRINHVTYGATDADLFGDPSRTELQRQQVFVGFGYTY